MTTVDEFRYLAGIGVNFGVTDNEALVIIPSFAPTEEGTIQMEEGTIQIIHSDSESVVEYKLRRISVNTSSR